MSLTEVAKVGQVRLMVVTAGGSNPGFFSLIRAEAPPESEWRAYLPLLTAELEIYTPLMLGECGLQSVVLCDEVTSRGRTASGLSDIKEGRIYLAVTELEGRRDRARRTVHHELFHLFDFRHGAGYGPDPDWSKLNDRSFRYGEGGWHDTAPDAGLPDKSVRGFLNRYSRSGSEEDKAEVYAHLMAGKDLVEGRVKDDVVLRSKCEEMRRRMSRFFPEVGPAFWDRSHESRRD